MWTPYALVCEIANYNDLAAWWLGLARWWESQGELDNAAECHAECAYNQEKAAALQPALAQAFKAA